MDSTARDREAFVDLGAITANVSPAQTLNPTTNVQERAVPRCLMVVRSARYSTSSRVVMDLSTFDPSGRPYAALCGGAHRVSVEIR